MSVTRLLVLGATRIFQPAHGYVVVRELASWQAEDWASIKPGSVYNALKTLTKQGFLEEVDPQQDKTTYRLTGDGETEFQRLVRFALWELHPHEPAWLYAGMSFWWALPRQEVADALEARAAQLTARLTGSGYAEEQFLRSRGTGPTPGHVVEFFRLHSAELRGELEWVEAARKRVQAGDYEFADES